MKKIFITILMLLVSQTVFACDATLIPDKNYFVITQTPVRQLKTADKTILSAQIMASIFGDKNQIILTPKNIGKTRLFVNDKSYLIEVSREQKEEWNIEDIKFLEIDNPPTENWGAQK